ncbi:MAG TPA: anti-sigma factor antagonist [Lachnospiraceae bacterium]|nr:anti-sigma factor antagonist [Lachnospiraceae bacterium]
MLNIVSEQNGNEVTIFIEGRLDTNSSPELSKEIGKYINSVDRIILDIEKLVYISSAGLRVLLAADQDMEAKDKEFNVKNVTGEIMGIFEMTGFSNALTII